MNVAPGGSGVRASWNLDAIGAAFAEAAVDASRWNAAMDVAGEVTGSFGAVLVPFRGRLPNLPYSESVGPVIEAYFNGGWAKARNAPCPREGITKDRC
jgi:hypothetical protein